VPAAERLTLILNLYGYRTTW